MKLRQFLQIIALVAFSAPRGRSCPDGKVFETARDVTSLVLGVGSFSRNVREGNMWGARHAKEFKYRLLRK